MRSERALLITLTIAGIAFRIPLIFGGGIWADEAMALNVAAIPTFTAMIDFLRHHESHPPLFYLVLRGWRALAGAGDSATFGLILFFSALLVPSVFAVTRSFSSRRAATIAASLVAISPAVAEHASQVRPYGMLHLLVLFSSYWLVGSIEKGGWKQWFAFVISAALTLYMHNWGWIVFGAHGVAAALVIWKLKTAHRRQKALEFGFAVTAVLILYSPWLSALIFQGANAGHSGLHLETLGDKLGFLLFAFISIPDYLLLGLYPPDQFPQILLAGVVAAAVLLATSRGSEKQGIRVQRNALSDNRNTIVLRFLITTVAVAVTTAVIASPWKTLFIQRCVAILSPLVMICLGVVIDRMLMNEQKRQTRAIAKAIVAFLLTLQIVGILRLVPTTRSNALEVALAVQRSMSAGDLLVVSPEWFAASFNHYFPSSIEQRDHPAGIRSNLIDFTSPSRRAVDTAATRRLAEAISAASESGRRVWFVTERRYLRYVEDVLPTLTSEAERARYASVSRVAESRHILLTAYGTPDTSHFVHGAVPRYEELLPYLFVPRGPGKRTF